MRGLGWGHRVNSFRGLRIFFFSAVGARYVSISSYQASRDDELSFVRGAVVRVIKKYVDGWWLVR